ncbi:hypothetical protein ACZ11_23110 [Lysinibacillus xylanilyticus]|uniref:Uncharacterized protein n=1 Tax=Lysinibacillus xylanilyticus TaxID=582475 RepID=A0A0K9F1S4_9BACI|nr:hypothetical protein [Lysinibacillus xylanilyticus]KMY28136.1 hypothetical protein ACZ11_23110 [Lysinibacillus xylanilyticus]
MKKALLLLLAVMLVGCSGEGTEKKKEEDVKKEEVIKEEKVVPVKFEEVDPESKATVEKFVKKYNVRVDFIKQYQEKGIEIAKIQEPITSELNKEENTLSQILLETDYKKHKGHYKIDAKYNEDKKIIGYTISIEGVPANELSENGEEWAEGIISTMAIADALGLNIDKYDEESDIAFDEENYTYTDPNTKTNVTFLYADWDLGKFEIKYDLSK